MEIHIYLFCFHQLAFVPSAYGHKGFTFLTHFTYACAQLLHTYIEKHLESQKYFSMI